MGGPKSSDLSMNWAFDSKTNTIRSAREVFNNPHWKETGRYSCLGCREIEEQDILNHENGKKETMLEHVNHDEHPFFRKAKLHQHSERCRFRDPVGTVISLAKRNKIDVNEHTKVLRIWTSAKLVRKLGDPHGYSRQAKIKFFTHPPHRKFYYFLSSLLKDYEVTTFRQHVSTYCVETEAGEKIPFADMFGYQDDVIKRVEKEQEQSSCLMVVVGTIKSIVDKGHVVLHFTTSLNQKDKNSRPFRLFVHQDYKRDVGNLQLLGNQKVACYGFAEKKILPNGNVFQIELHSIRHQIFFFNDIPSPEQIGSVDPSEDPVELANKEIIGFLTENGTYRLMEVAEVTELLHHHQRVKWEKLKAECLQEERNWEDYLSFMNHWDDKHAAMHRHNQKLKQQRDALQIAQEDKEKEAAKLTSKFGFNQKIREQLKIGIAKLIAEIFQIKQRVSSLQEEIDLLHNKRVTWGHWRQSLEQKKSNLSQYEHWAKKEEAVKDVIRVFHSMLFRVLIDHPEWNLIFGFQCTKEDEECITVRAVFQIYVIQDHGWIPADHPLQEQMIEGKINIQKLNASPLDSLSRFFSGVETEALRVVQLLGWPTRKFKCPRCSGLLKLKKYHNAMYLICKDGRCAGKHKLSW